MQCNEDVVNRGYGAMAEALLFVRCMEEIFKKIIKYFALNKKRHIKEHHGEIFGKWVLKRYQCRACSKNNKIKTAKRPSNLQTHYS